MLAQIAALIWVFGVKFGIHFHFWVTEVHRLALHSTEFQTAFKNLLLTNKRIYHICGTKVSVIELWIFEFVLEFLGTKINTCHLQHRAFEKSLSGCCYHVGYVVVQDLVNLAEFGDVASQLTILTMCRLWAKHHFCIVYDCYQLCSWYCVMWFVFNCKVTLQIISINSEVLTFQAGSATYNCSQLYVA